MKFSIGDKVRLKQTGDEGEVVSLLNDKMAEVSVGGTVFPAFTDELEHPYLEWFTNKATRKKKISLPEQLPVEKITARIPKLAKGTYLSFIPVFADDAFDEVVDYLKIYLVNELPFDIKYTYEQRVGENSIFKLDGVIHAFGNIYLHNVPYANMNDKPKFHWKLAHHTNIKIAPAEGMLRIKPEKLFEHINQVISKNEPAFSYQLIADFLPEPVKPLPNENFPEPLKPIIKEKTAKDKFTSINNLEPAKYELDLHIEALVKNLNGLTNSDMLKIQLDTLEKYLHLAIVHRQHSMVVIHGLGKGTLKEEVHKVLKRTPEVGRYKNEWSAKYGFGATEIVFRY